MTAFDIFGLKIYWYGIFYAIGFIVGYGFLYIIGKYKIFKDFKNLQNLLERGIDDLSIAVILGVLIGGRLGHILFYDLSYYIYNPLKIFAIWEGGMGFVGGVIGVILGVLIIKRLYRLSYAEFLYLMDIIVSILPLGIMLGRIGNYLNQELIGKIMNYELGILNGIMDKLGLIHIYDKVDDMPRINTNFLESFFEGFCLLVFLQFKFWERTISSAKSYLLKPGYISAMFLIGYGIIRFIMEFLRDYTAMEYIWIFTKTQYFMFGFILSGILLIYFGKKLNK